MNMKKKVVYFIGGLLLAVFCLAQGHAQAADTKIGVIDMKQVLSTSTSGKRAENIIKQKVDSLQASLKSKESELAKMRQEMEVKGSAWNDSMKKQKVAEFQKAGQDFAKAQDDANQEIRRLREQNVNPILKKLEEVVSKIAADDNYAVILPRNVVLYTADSVDLTNKVITELNKVMK